MVDGRFCSRGLELRRRELMQEIETCCGEDAFEFDYGASPAESLQILDDLEVDARTCFNPVNPPLPPALIFAAFTSLARRIPKLRRLRWDIDEEEEAEGEGGSFVWRVDRGEDGEPRLVDEGSTYRPKYCCFSSTAVDLVTRGLVPNPLFDASAGREPKTLDDFLVRCA